MPGCAPIRGKPAMIAIPVKAMIMPAQRRQPNDSRNSSQVMSAANGTDICMASAPVPASMYCTPTSASPKCSVHSVVEMSISGTTMPRGDFANQTSAAEATTRRKPSSR